MPLKIVRNDITKMEVDAIVNAASTTMCESAEDEIGTRQLYAALKLPQICPWGFAFQKPVCKKSSVN